MKLGFVIALGLSLGLVVVSVSAQVPVATESYPAPSRETTESDYGVHTDPNCPDGSTAKFWGVFSDNGGSSWVVVYRCVV